MENIKRKALLVISFGTSHMDTRQKTIEACEKRLRDRFPDYDFYRSWTSKMIIKKLKTRDNEEVLYPSQALDLLLEKGYKEVYIQSLHLICGEEYNKMMNIIDNYRHKFDKILVGRPLLTSLEDYDYVTDLIKEVSLEDTKLDLKRSASVWMGHGTGHQAHASYAAIDYRLSRNSIKAYLATVEGYPEIEDMIFFLKKDGIEKIHLRPFLLVAGDHAKNDMAGQEEDSWLSILRAEGFEVEVHMEGMGEFEAIQDKFVENLADAIEEDRRIGVACRDQEVEAGRFYGIGTGPGDSQLLTIKAAKTLDKLDILYLPQAKIGGESRVRKIVDPYLRPDLVLKERHFPMSYDSQEKRESWDAISKEIIDDVRHGKQVGFVSLGDPMLYSTYVYLLDRLIDRVEIETIPGLSSFSNIAASNNFSLAMDTDPMLVYPCTGSMEEIERMVDIFDSIVLMKVYKRCRPIIEMLEAKGLADKSIMVSNSAMEEELVYRDISQAKDLDSYSYFTTIIVNKKTYKANI
ncbi:cobalt-factor II C(20)-methyltransferase [Peptostreptococcus sp.]